MYDIIHCIDFSQLYVANCRSESIHIIGFFYAESPFDLGVVTHVAICIIRDIHIAISSKNFGPSALAVTKSFAKIG